MSYNKINHTCINRALINIIFKMINHSYQNFSKIDKYNRIMLKIINYVIKLFNTKTMKYLTDKLNYNQII